ncbi:MAG TPA: type II toxin-antitoxin system VapC family toxin [Candidatus Acidoferrales bacterium]|nr:type II toxin-antitoxin system VapC family toxin [Candidatus Acidoferrales bacterium]
MAVLVDTNVLLRLLQPHHPHAHMAQKALDILRARREPLTIAFQNLVEFWAVITRPLADNGLGFTTEEAVAEIGALKRFFVLLPELPLQREWERLVVTYGVSGKNTHDARLAAAMAVHSVNSILTFNTHDFARYAGISVLDPRTLS